MKSISSLNFQYSTANWPSRFNEEFDNLHNHIGILSEEESELISKYLSIFSDKRAGWMSYPPNPIDESQTIDWEGGHDGVYAWDGITHYLIDKYRVDPPMEFRLYVCERMKDISRIECESKDIDHGIMYPRMKVIDGELVSQKSAITAWVRYP